MPPLPDATVTSGSRGALTRHRTPGASPPVPQGFSLPGHPDGERATLCLPAGGGGSGEDQPERRAGANTDGGRTTGSGPYSHKDEESPTTTPNQAHATRVQIPLGYSSSCCLQAGRIDVLLAFRRDARDDPGVAVLVTLDGVFLEVRPAPVHEYEAEGEDVLRATG